MVGDADDPAPRSRKLAAFPPLAKWILVVAAVVAGAALVAVALSRSDEETPERAIYNLAHDVEHVDVWGVCERLFPRSALPPLASERLDLPAGRAGASWDAEHRRCLRRFQQRSELETLGFEDPRVRSVRRLSVTPQQGVTSVATARR